MTPTTDLKREWRRLGADEQAPCQHGSGCAVPAAWCEMVWLPFGGIGFYYYCGKHRQATRVNEEEA